MHSQKTPSKRPTRPIRWLGWWGLLVFFSANHDAHGDDATDAFFEKEIRPVLVTRCVSCHGPGRQEARIRLDSREAISQIETSHLIAVIRGETSAPVSCVPELHLADALHRWIDLGYPWPENVTVTSPGDRDEMARRHWAFQPVQKPIVPRATGADHPIDAFVMATLAEHNLSASPPADRSQMCSWARRSRYSSP